MARRAELRRPRSKRTRLSSESFVCSPSVHRGTGPILLEWPCSSGSVQRCLPLAKSTDRTVGSGSHVPPVMFQGPAGREAKQARMQRGSGEAPVLLSTLTWHSGRKCRRSRVRKVAPRLVRSRQFLARGVARRRAHNRHANCRNNARNHDHSQQKQHVAGTQQRAPHLPMHERVAVSRHRVPGCAVTPLSALTSRAGRQYPSGIDATQTHMRRAKGPFCNLSASVCHPLRFNMQPHEPSELRSYPWARR